MSFVYCRELAPGTVSLTGDWARGDDSKQNSYYIYITLNDNNNSFRLPMPIKCAFF